MIITRESFLKFAGESHSYYNNTCCELIPYSVKESNRFSLVTTIGKNAFVIKFAAKRGSLEDYRLFFTIVGQDLTAKEPYLLPINLEAAYRMYECGKNMAVTVISKPEQFSLLNLDLKPGSANLINNCNIPIFYDKDVLYDVIDTIYTELRIESLI